MNGRLRNVLWDPQVTGSTPSEEDEEIWCLLYYRVLSKAPGQGLQVVLSETTTMSELNREPILARTSSRIKSSVLPPFGPRGGQ